MPPTPTPPRKFSTTPRPSTHNTTWVSLCCAVPNIPPQRFFLILGNRWGSNLSGSFVGRRPDDDFLGFNINHAAGYVRADLGGWYALNSRVTAYANIENALDRRYNEVVGYPALPLNFRAGFRFRIGGE